MPEFFPRVLSKIVHSSGGMTMQWIPKEGKLDIKCDLKT